jgi:hypothetical protein
MVLGRFRPGSVGVIYSIIAFRWRVLIESLLYDPTRGPQAVAPPLRRSLSSLCPLCIRSRPCLLIGGQVGVPDKEKQKRKEGPKRPKRGRIGRHAAYVGTHQDADHEAPRVCQCYSLLQDTPDRCDRTSGGAGSGSAGLFPGLAQNWPWGGAGMARGPTTSVGEGGDIRPCDKGTYSTNVTDARQACRMGRRGQCQYTHRTRSPLTLCRNDGGLGGLG